MTTPDDAIRVLHVDDGPGVAETAAAHLERENPQLDVETVMDAAAGLDRLDAGVDCVVSDYDIPGRNGIEFLEAVRERFPDVPFILYTGKGSEEVASEAITAGVTDYLQKETGTGQYAVLANRIENAVDQYRSQQDLESSQERLSLFVEQSPLGVLELDEEFTVVGLNEAGEDILGYAEADLTGQGWETIVPPSSHDDVAEVAAALAEVEGGYHSINENVREDGEHIVCEWHNRLVTDDDGAVVAVFSLFQDVTDRERRKERIEQHSARLEALFEHSPDMINVHDDDGNLIDPNPRLVEATGYSRAELTERAVWDLDRSMTPQQARELWDGMDVGDRRRLTGRYERRDGSTFPVEVHLRRINIDGESRFVAISRDISERLERERELERTNTLLSTLFETLPVGVIAEDESRNVLAANGRLFDLFDLPDEPGEVVGADCERMAEDVSTMFRDPETFVERTNETVARHEAVAGEEWSLRDGRTFVRNHTSIDLEDGTGHLWVYRDVTDQKAHEERLEALNGTMQSLLTADSRESIADIGAAAAADILPLEAAVVYLFDEDRSELVPAATAGSLGDPSPVTDPAALPWQVALEGETRLVADANGDGVAGTGVLGPDSPLRSHLLLPVEGFGVLAAGARAVDAFDEGSVVLGEILVRNLAAGLEQVAQTEQLRARGEELSRQNDRLEAFTRVVSHDLRNPLNVAQGRLELAREALEGEDGSPASADVLDHLESAGRAHDRMAALVEDLLRLAAEGTTVAETEPVDLAAVARAGWASVETGRATLQTPTDAAVLADSSRLQQLFENLVRNSVEHGSTGSRPGADGGTAHGADVTVTVGTFDSGFYVADDGPGIPADVREDVFSLGYSTADDGTGFGLGIVERVAEAHGWDVRVTESADGGARFEVTDVTFT